MNKQIFIRPPNDGKSSDEPISVELPNADSSDFLIRLSAIKKLLNLESGGDNVVLCQIESIKVRLNDYTAKLATDNESEGVDQNEELLWDILCKHYPDFEKKLQQQIILQAFGIIDVILGTRDYAALKGFILGLPLSILQSEPFLSEFCSRLTWIFDFILKEKRE